MNKQTKIVWSTLHAATGELLITPTLLEFLSDRDPGPDISARIVVSKLDEDHPGKTVVIASITDRDGCRPRLQTRTVADIYTSAAAGRGSVEEAARRVVAYHKTRLAKVIRRAIAKHRDRQWDKMERIRQQERAWDSQNS